MREFWNSQREVVVKLFVSWSGETSKALALVFREWLPMINHSIDPYVSAEDIQKGRRWSSEIAKELAATTFGIVILTSENRKSEWLHFEAGAIARSVETVGWRRSCSG